MPRTTLVFRLSSARIQEDLLREFSLHPGVDASPHVVDGAPTVTVEVSDAASAVLDVRATVGMFDDRASEVEGQG